MFFEEMLALRLPENATETTLRPLADKSGFFGDGKTMTFEPAGAAKPPTAPVSWLPTEKLARTWLAIVSGKPFEP